MQKGIVAAIILLTLFVILVAGTGLYTRSARFAAEEMFASLEVGVIPAEFEGSARQLGENLLEFGLPDYDIKSIRLFPLFPTTAVITLQSGDEQVRIFLTMERSGGNWIASKATDSMLTVRLDDGLPVLVLDFGAQSLSQDLQPLGQDKLLTVRTEAQEWLNLGWQTPQPYFASFVEAQPQGLIIGMQGVDLYGYNGRLAAAVSGSPFVPEIIRVNLSTTGHESIYHKSVTISADASWKAVEAVTGKALYLAPGIVALEPQGDGILLSNAGGEELFSNRLIFTPQHESQLTLTSITRSGRRPAYYGSLEVANMGGELVVVNELALEKYLRFVLPSEMPSSFGARALEVQAIVARTYALRNLLASGWRSTSAHVVDSVLSQVYNNSLENAAATAAVEATRGEIVILGGSPADVRYFSTSSGHTANAHEVWPDNQGNFPGSPVDGLSSQPQYPGEALLVTGEAAFADYISNPPGDAYDSKSAWFRWQVTISAPQLESITRNSFRTIHQSSPASLQRQNAAGDFEIVEALPEDPLGTLIDLVPVQRGEGGVLMAVDFVGSNGTWRVYREYYIRIALRPVGTSSQALELVRRDGSRQNNLSMLPSAYVHWELKSSEQGLEEITFYGGGYGHGVGMSQYGVRELAARGWSRAQIIQHYFLGTEIGKIY